jgi:hypothetical protein
MDFQSATTNVMIAHIRYYDKEGELVSFDSCSLPMKGIAKVKISIIEPNFVPEIVDAAGLT